MHRPLRWYCEIKQPAAGECTCQNFFRNNEICTTPTWEPYAATACTPSLDYSTGCCDTSMYDSCGSLIHAARKPHSYDPTGAMYRIDPDTPVQF
jgi:hypothetical protein